MKEGPATPAKKRQSGPVLPLDRSGSLGRETDAPDNPLAHRELKQRVLDAAWQAIGDALSPPRAKGIAAPMREGKPNARSVMVRPFSWPHAQRRSHHFGQLPSAHKDRRFQRSIRSNT